MHLVATLPDIDDEKLYPTGKGQPCPLGPVDVLRSRAGIPPATDAGSADQAGTWSEHGSAGAIVICNDGGNVIYSAGPAQLFPPKASETDYAGRPVTSTRRVATGVTVLGGEVQYLPGERDAVEGCVVTWQAPGSADFHIDLIDTRSRTPKDVCVKELAPIVPTVFARLTS